jgi:hypothetical protein
MDTLIATINAFLTCNNGLLIITTIIDNYEDSIIAAGAVTTLLTLVTNSTATIVQFNTLTSRVAFLSALEPESDSKQDPTKLPLEIVIPIALFSKSVSCGTIT